MMLLCFGFAFTPLSVPGVYYLDPDKEKMKIAEPTRLVDSNFTVGGDLTADEDKFIEKGKRVPVAYILKPTSSGAHITKSGDALVSYLDPDEEKLKTAFPRNFNDAITPLNADVVYYLDPDEEKTKIADHAMLGDRNFAVVRVACLMKPSSSGFHFAKSDEALVSDLDQDEEKMKTAFPKNSNDAITRRTVDVLYYLDPDEESTKLADQTVLGDRNCAVVAAAHMRMRMQPATVKPPQNGNLLVACLMKPTSSGAHVAKSVAALGSYLDSVEEKMKTAFTRKPPNEMLLRQPR